MPTQPYYNARGERLPGVTWVIGGNLGWNKDPLMLWANKEGLAGRSIRGERTTATVAADIGTAAHAMIEARILGNSLDVPELKLLTPDAREKAQTGYKSFDRWYRNSRLVVLATELWGVSEDYQTGWCLDALALNEAERCLELLDWKSSKGTYADHFIQAATYTKFEETRLSGWLEEDVKFGGAHVVRVGKDNGIFKHVFWPRPILDKGWTAFTWLRALHQMKPELESYVR